MRRALLLATLSLVALASQVTTASGAGETKPRVTLFGDSVAAALASQSKARKLLSKGLDLRIDARVCRRLAETGCPYQGDRPSSVLSLVEQPAKLLGDVVVIDVGYNDVPTDYATDIERVMQVLGRQGVSRVIWVTMRDRPLYRPTNAAIDAAARRWPQITVADWHQASRSRTAWFANDGLHLTTSGALALARFLRPLVLATACNRGCRGEQRVAETG
jgi:hypothetical protein